MNNEASISNHRRGCQIPEIPEIPGGLGVRICYDPFASEGPVAKKILIADDDAVVRSVARRALTGLGEILEAVDGDKAIEIVRAQRPNVVLLDIHMPRIDGIAALDEMLALDPGLAVVIVTGDGYAERTRLAQERGARAYLLKPLDIEKLRQTVRSYL